MQPTPNTCFPSVFWNRLGSFAIFCHPVVDSARCSKISARSRDFLQSWWDSWAPWWDSWAPTTKKELVVWSPILFPLKAVGCLFVVNLRKRLLWQMNFLVKFLVPWVSRYQSDFLKRAWGWWFRGFHFNSFLMFCVVLYHSTVFIVPKCLRCIVSRVSSWLLPDEVVGLVTLHAHSVKPPAAWEDGRSSTVKKIAEWLLL